MKIAALLPHSHGHRSPVWWKSTLTKKEIGNLIDTVYRHCGQKATVIFVFLSWVWASQEAAKAGISFGNHRHPPERKKALVAETRKLVEEYEQQYAGWSDHPAARSITRWSTPGTSATDRVADEMMAEISTKKFGARTGGKRRSTRSG